MPFSKRHQVLESSHVEAPDGEDRMGGSWKLVLAAGILLCEYLLLSHAVDAQTALARGGVWRVAGELGALGPLAVSWGATWFALFRLAPTVALEAPPKTAAAVRSFHFRRLPWLLAHAGAFAALFVVSKAVFGDRAAPPGPGFAWLGSWIILAVLSAASALIGVLGGARWFTVLRRDLLVVGPRGVLVWFAGLASATMWTKFPDVTLTPVVAALRSLSVHATGTPQSFLLRVERWTMVISPGCSGYEGFGIAVGLIAVYLLRFRRHFRYPMALSAIPMSLLAVWLANVARFMVLGLVGSRFGASVAVSSFHSKASWMLAAAVTLLVIRALRSNSRPQHPAG